LIVCIESSAAAKLLVEEDESEELAAYLDALVSGGAAVVAGTILETELRRLAIRLDIDQSLVTEVVDRVALVETDGDLHRDAGLLPGRFLRSLDALHIAVARRVGADVLVSYDHRQLTGAESIGLSVASPGRSG
jgi:predicted nucleic acid-binding protein